MQNRNPKVSVLTPLYNTPLEHLKQTIDSILSQTFTDFEFLLVNDSPENTELDKFIATYDDDRIRYIKNDKNIGLEASTNKLLDMARGEYVAIFDHDDISLPERLEKEVAYLDKHPKVGVCSAQFEVFGVQSWTSENPVSSDAIKKKLQTESCVSHTTAMFRKSVLDEHNIRYEKGFFPAASYRIVTRLALVTDLHNLPDVLLRYRMDGENTSIRHADKRVVAREKLRREYSDEYKARQISKIFKLDNITVLGSGHHIDERRYYKASKGKESYFIKSADTAYDIEFAFAKRAYEKNPSLFIEPIATHEGDINCYVSRWTEGATDLDKYIEKHNLTDAQKDVFIDDLVDIFEVLWQEGIVHRDIIPRNFVVADGRLKLIDFYFAVDHDNYKEYDHIKEDIALIRGMGESFAAGVFKWDDAYSFEKLAQYIVGGDSLEKYPRVQQVSKRVGQRVIEPETEVLGANVVKLQTMLDEVNEHNLKQNDLISHLHDHNKRQHEVIQSLTAMLENTADRKVRRTLGKVKRRAKRALGRSKGG